MKPVIRYQSQLLFRKSYKPARTLRIRPLIRLNVVARVAGRFGIRPRLGLE